LNFGPKIQLSSRQMTEQYVEIGPEHYFPNPFKFDRCDYHLMSFTTKWPTVHIGSHCEIKQ
jgi:hypothetical protein